MPRCTKCIQVQVSCACQAQQAVPAVLSWGVVRSLSGDSRCRFDQRSITKNWGASACTESSFGCSNLQVHGMRPRPKRGLGRSRVIVAITAGCVLTAVLLLLYNTFAQTRVLAKDSPATTEAQPAARQTITAIVGVQVWPNPVACARQTQHQQH